MRILRNLFVLAVFASMSFATTAYATTVNPKVITLEYSRATKDKDPFDTAFNTNDIVLVEISLTASRVDNLTGNSDYSLFTDANGSIRVFNGTQTGVTPITLDAAGVEIRVYNGSVQFGSLGTSVDNLGTGKTFLELSSGRNNIQLGGLEAGDDFDELLVALSSNTAPDDFGKLRIRKTRSGKGPQAVLQSKDSNPAVDTLTVSLSTVPLPAGAWLLLGGVGIMALRRKRAA